MRIAIISDVHSNADALSAVMSAIDRAKVDRLICLGDVVGYGADPAECCRLVRGASEVTLLGNHDAAVSGRMDYSFYYSAARQAIDWTIANLEESEHLWLRSLPYTYRFGDLGFSHGSPIEPRAYEYVFALQQAQELRDYVGSLPFVTFIGHSHLCRVYAIDEERVQDALSSRVRLERSYKYLISVGSVGQPRDNDSRACFVIYDTDEKTVEFRRVEYDAASAARKIMAAKLAPNFGKRLLLGV